MAIAADIFGAANDGTLIRGIGITIIIRDINSFNLIYQSHFFASKKINFKTNNYIFKEYRWFMNINILNTKINISI
jgi:hypothetical protein